MVVDPHVLSGAVNTGQKLVDDLLLLIPCRLCVDSRGQIIMHREITGDVRTNTRDDFVLNEFCRRVKFETRSPKVSTLLSPAVVIVHVPIRSRALSIREFISLKGESLIHCSSGAWRKNFF